MEDELTKEFKKCLNNPLYFYNNYVVVMDENGNKQPRELTPDQEKVVEKLRDYFVEHVDKPIMEELWKEQKD